MPHFILALTNARLEVRKLYFAQKAEAAQEARKAIREGAAITATVFRDYGFLGSPVAVYRISKGRKQGRKK